MIGYALAFLAAFFESLKDVLTKNRVKKVDEYVVAFSMHLFTTVFLCLALLFQGLPEIKPGFWPITLLKAGIAACASLLYVKGLKSSDLSIGIPMMAFTPVFMLVTSPIIVGEFPNSIGLLGVLLIFFGSYILKIEDRSSFFGPFKSLLKETGPKCFLGIAFLWSIGANLDKIGMETSSILLYATTTFGLTTAMLFPIVLSKAADFKASFTNNLKDLFLLGLVFTFVIGAHFTALNYLLVIYVISIKRSSILLSVLWGGMYFKEKSFKNRLLGSIVMFLGMLFILFA